jgi:hypothetical protein
MEGTVFPVSATAYAGIYSIRLETTGDECGNVRDGWITTGESTDTGPAGGRPYTLMTDTLTGYYRYTAMGSDSGTMFVQFTNNGSQVGGSMHNFAPAAAWTYFELPLSAFSTPDTIRIDAYSSNWPSDSTNNGSALYLDNLQLKSEPLGVIDLSAGGTNGSVAFPNPVHDVLNIRLPQGNNETLRFAIYDVTGRMVIPGNINSNTGVYRMYVSQLGSGVYVYELIGTNTRERGRFVKE